jgi:hypothetical protein
MKGWIKGDFMAYRPGVVEPQKANALTFAGSELFKRTFEEGMSMVEETATYLDGKGRAESKLLPSKAALTYAGESMRLTTRLMQVASWLLVQRAVSEGEMTPDEAEKEKYRLGAREICRGSRGEPICSAAARTSTNASSASTSCSMARKKPCQLASTPNSAASTQPLAWQQSKLLRRCHLFPSPEFGRRWRVVPQHSATACPAEALMRASPHQAC